MRRWFLSYNSQDFHLAEALEAELRSRDPDIAIFFAPKSLRPGAYWMPTLAKEIGDAAAFVLLVGEKGLGPWQSMEYYEALDRRVKAHNFPVVLVLLDGQPAPGLPFLRQLHWIVTADPGAAKSVAELMNAAAGGAAPSGELWRHTAPYRGLHAMTESDADFFFGRGRETVEVISALAAGPDKLPILLGNSGVGKSSLAQAGVLAAFMRQDWPETAEARPPWPQAFNDSRRWCFLKLRPGTEPVRALVEPFLWTWQFDAVDPQRAKLQTSWVNNLIEGSVNLRDLLDATEARYRDELRQPKPPAFLLYIDQGEELYVRAEERQRRRFSEILAHGLSDPRLRAMMSMRTDFFGELQKDEPLYAAHHQINVPPLREAELREVVSRPAALLAARFEADGLAAYIAQRTAEESTKDAGALPLLSYLLDDMWTQMVQRGDGILRLPAEAVELGRVLVERADAFLEAHPKAEDQLRRIFTLKLATVREDGEPTRRRALRSEFTEEEWRLVNELADHPNRLLVVATPETGESYAEVAHEAIFRRWDKLRGWIAGEREFLAWRSRLESERRAWAAAPEESKNDALLMGLALAQAHSWLVKRAEDLPRVDREFIDLSLRRDALEREQREQARRQQERLRRRMLQFSTAGLIVVTALLIFAAFQWYEAKNQKEATSHALATMTRNADAVVAIFLDPNTTPPVELTEQMLKPAIAAYADVIRLDPHLFAAFFGRANAYSLEKDYDRAIADYDRALELDPQHALAFNRRGSAYAGKRDFERAIKDFDAALALDPKLKEAMHGRGLAYLGKGAYGDAIHDFDQALALDSKNAAAYAARGAAYAANGDAEHAMADFDAGLAIDAKVQQNIPRDAQIASAYVKRGNGFLAKNEADRALRDFDQAVWHDPKSHVALNQRGNAYVAKGDYEHAVNDYDRAIALNPKYALAFRNRGSGYARKGDGDRAIRDYDRAIELDPKYALAFVDRGTAYFNKGEGSYDQAIQDYTAAIQLDAKYALAYSYRGNTFARKGDYDRAIEDLNRAVELDPKNASFLYTRGNAYASQRDYDRAILDFGRAIELDPKNAVAYTQRGNLYLNKGDYDRAIPDYEQAILLDPKYATAYNQRGNAYFGKADYDRALRDYTQAIAIHPNYPLAYSNRGNTYFSKGDPDHAIEDLDRSVELDAKFPTAYYNRGNAFQRKGDHVRAIHDYDRAIALNPKYTTAYHGRGVSYFNRGDYDHAILDFDEAIKLDANYALAHVDRGNSYFVKHQYDRAIEDYGEAIRIKPKYAVAYNFRGNAYNRKTDYDRAIADIDEALRIDPKYALAYRNRGFVYYYKGAYERAIEDFEQAIALDARVAGAFYGRGLAKQKKGDAEGGEADIAKAKSIDPKVSTP
jgi:tetratricopeptide (TPR) repeat protein